MSHNQPGFSRAKWRIPGNWYRGGSANFDYSAVPLAGLQSLRCDSSKGDYALYQPGGALNNSEIWFNLLFKVEGPLPPSFKPLVWFDGYNVYLLPDGTLQVSDNGKHILTTTVDGLSAGTVYNIWGHYRKGTGSNAVCEVSFDIVGHPRPNSGNKWAGGTTGDGTANDASLILWYPSGSGVGVFDNVQVSNTDVFGNQPASTPTPTATATATFTPTATATATSTSTPTPTATATATSTPTPTATATATSTSTPTPTATATATTTSTPTPTATVTSTPAPSPTLTPSPTPTPTYIINEDFEGSGTPGNWYRGGSANFDYSAVPLAGLQSLRCDSSKGDYALYQPGGALNNSEIWFNLLFKVEGPLPPSFKPLVWFDGYNVYLLPDGTLQVSDNGKHILTTTVDGLSAGTVYNIWGHYRKGTGSNAVCEVSFDIVGHPRPNSGNKWAGGTTGDGTANATSLILWYPSGSGVGVFDNVQVSNTDQW